MGFFTNSRIRFLIGLFIYFLLIAVIFLPIINITVTDSSLNATESVLGSLYWFYSQTGYPEIYTIIAIVYGILGLPITVSFFVNSQKIWPLALSLVSMAVYFLVNCFWTGIILYSVAGFASQITLTVWGWIYILAQIIGIVSLICFIVQVKRERQN